MCAGEVTLCLTAGLQHTNVFIVNNPSIVFSINRFLGLFKKMLNNVDQRFVSFCPKLKDLQFTVTKDEKKPEDVHVLEAGIILIAGSDLINRE